jgi:putative endonuclease
MQWLDRLLGRSLKENEDRRRGRVGEELAARQLETLGYRILERNWRCPLGEIDLIAKINDLIVVVEVKTSLRRGQFVPEQRVNSRKQVKLRNLAAYYLKHRAPGASIRFDVVAVWWDDLQSPRIQHIENAFR